MRGTLVIGIVVLGLLILCGRGFLRSNVTETGVPTVEMAVFQAAFGLDWHLAMAREFEEYRRQQGRPVQVKLWGDPRVNDKVKPRILQGAPPDLSMCYLPYWRLVASNKLRSFNEFLDSPAMGQSQLTWRETFLPGALEPNTYHGQVYAIPLAYTATFLYYDKKLFRDQGWTVPASWDELIGLCQKAQTAGLGPIAFQGKYPAYGMFLFWPIVERCGGQQLMERINRAAPGCFEEPDFIWACRLAQELSTKYFQQGAMAMSHTEAQMEFCKRKAVLVCCGLWLETEMKKNWPVDFELDCFPVPPVPGGKGLPGTIYAGVGEETLMFAEGHNSKDAGELLKFMFARDHIAQFAKAKATITTIKGGTPPEGLSPAMRTAFGYIQNASKTYTDRIGNLFPTWQDEVFTPQIESLLRGQITPEQFGKILDEGLERIRRDPYLFKPPLLEEAERSS